MASASTGFMLRMISASSAVRAKDWPMAWTICDGRKSTVAQSLVSPVAIQQAKPISALPSARTQRPSIRRSSHASGRAIASCGRAIHSRTVPTCSSRKFCTV